MILAIVGGRKYSDQEQFDKTMAEFTAEHGAPEAIVSGGANGADKMAREYANKHGIRLIEHIPEWEKFGRSAGFKRNKLIIDDCDRVIAFWDGESKGTKSSIDLAKKSNKIAKIVLYVERKEA